jgi:hypothetical protein
MISVAQGLPWQKLSVSYAVRDVCIGSEADIAHARVAIDKCWFLLGGS